MAQGWLYQDNGRGETVEELFLDVVQRREALDGLQIIRVHRLLASRDLPRPVLLEE